MAKSKYIQPIRLRAISAVIAERGTTTHNGEAITNANQFRIAAGISSYDTAAPIYDGGRRDESNNRIDAPLERIGVKALSNTFALLGISLDEPISTLFEYAEPMNGKPKKKKAPK